MDFKHVDVNPGRSSEAFENAEPLPRRGTRIAPEFVITETQRPGEPVAAVFERITEQLTPTRAEILSVMLYGSLRARSEIEQAMSDVLGTINWPITWVEGASCIGTALAGVQVFAIS